MPRTISANPTIQKHYEKCLRQGTSETLAEMFALGQPPMSNTDREFLEGHCNGNEFEKTPWIGDLYKAEAEAAGLDITGKKYLAGLAAYPGDPRAWVSGRADVQRVCEERGWGCQGAVNVKAQEPVSDMADAPLADDIVDNKVSDILSDLPESDVPHVDVEDLRGQVRDALTPHWQS
jgi:hypothetical protein